MKPQNIMPSVRLSKPEPPDYEAGVTSTQPLHLAATLVLTDALNEM
jgi:hypothetical protein